MECMYLSMCLYIYVCFMCFFLGFFLFPFVCFILFCLFCFISLYFFSRCLFVWVWVVGRHRGSERSRESVIRIYFMKKISVFKKKREKKSFPRAPSVMTLLSLAHTEAVLIWVLITRSLGSESHVPAFSMHCMLFCVCLLIYTLYRTETGIADATVNKWVSWNELRSVFLGGSL